MGRKLTALLFSLLLPSLFVLAIQDSPTAMLDITGVNATGLPTVEVSANIEDAFGRPVVGLTPGDITVTGDLADAAQVVQVENITDDELPFAVVLTIDTSESMSGLPLEQAKVAARLFVEQLRPEDSVAVVDFDSTARVVLPYTTDKDAALRAIDNLSADGRTALYDAGLLSVQTATETELSRRVAILLSDGAEFEDGRSTSSREAALQAALTDGVPVYTIGLGFGTDRTYLQSLAQATNAQFYESPTPNELEDIYAELSALLRSQYIVTLNVDVPADGAVYAFGLEATTLDGSLSDTSQLFTPVPVPVVNLLGAPAGEIAETTTITAEVLADDPLTSVTSQVDGGEVTPLTLDDAGEAVVTIDPVTFSPGEHTLTVTATDEDDESGSAMLDFTVAALPPSVTVETTVEDGFLSVSADTAGSQSAVTGADASFGDIARTTLEAVVDAPGQFTGTFPLLDLPAGDQTLTVTATDGEGNTTAEDVTVAVPSVAPVLEVSLEPDTVLEGPAVVTVGVTAQTDDVSLAYQFDGGEETPLGPEDSIPVDVVGLGAGSHTLTVNAADDNGTVGSVDVPFVVSDAAIPTPTFTPTFTPTATSTPTATPTNTPTTTPDLPATANAVASVTVEAQATADAFATLDAQATSDAVSTADAEATLNVESTDDAHATANVESTISVRQTEFIEVTSTADAQATLNAEASLEAQSTRVARATDNAVATADALASPTPSLTMTASPTVDATATLDAEATNDAEGTAVALGATSTLAADATAEELASIAQATDNAEATSDAVATADTQATLDAQATATQMSLDAEATDNAASTLDAQATADAEATSDAIATADTQATLDAQATATQMSLDAEATDNAASTLDAQATADAAATLDAVATTDAESTADAQGTADFNATLDAGATADAVATADAIATVDAQETSQVLGTRRANATATANLQTTIQAEVNIIAASETADAEATLDNAPTATATGGPRDVPSATAVGTPEEVAPITGADTGGGIPPWVYGVCGLGVLLLIVVGVLTAGRRRRSDNEDAT